MCGRARAGHVFGAVELCARYVHGAGRSVDFFFFAEVDGRPVRNSLEATERANYGRGLLLNPIVVGRNIPLRPATVKIVGRTHYAAPILAFINKVYEVSGTIEFTPERATMS